MKIKSIIYLFLLSVVFASCSDNGDSVNYGKKIAGVYDGYAVASCAYFENQVASAQKLSITATNADDIVAVSYESDTWGKITIEQAKVTESGNRYLISGSGTSLMGMGDKVSEYECSVSGAITDGKAELTFACPQIMGGLTIEFRQGDIPASIVVPGTYNGYTKADCAYFKDMYADNQTIEISAAGNDTYKAVLVSTTWGEFTVEGITATTTDGGVTFSLTGTGVTKMGMGGNVRDYDCSFAGTVDADKDAPTFTFTVPAVMGGLTLVFNTGDMPQQ